MSPDTLMNVAKSIKMLSVWVALIICGLVKYWLDLTPEAQQELLAQWPAIKNYGPQIAFVVWYAARVKAQGGIVLPWEIVPASSTAVQAIPGEAAEPVVAAPGRYTPADIEVLLKADQLLKAGRSVGTGA